MYENFIKYIKIPDELTIRQIQPEDVHILIGENGSGKSILLNKLAESSLNGNYSKVIALANTIYDKFSIRNNKFFALKASRGRQQAKETLKKALKNISSDSAKRIRFAYQVLNYVNYEPRIGFKVKFVDEKNIEREIDNLTIPIYRREELFPLLISA